MTRATLESIAGEQPLHQDHQFRVPLDGGLAAQQRRERARPAADDVVADRAPGDDNAVSGSVAHRNADVAAVDADQPVLGPIAVGDVEPDGGGDPLQQWLVSVVRAEDPGRLDPRDLRREVLAEEERVDAGKVRRDEPQPALGHRALPAV